MKKQHSGFTLIELVVVIVLLGILSVTVAPRFLGLQNDARSAVMDGIKAQLEFVINSVYYKSIIQATDDVYDTYTEVNGAQIRTYYGYPQEIWPNHIESLMNSSAVYMGNAYNNSSLLSETCTDTLCVVDQVKLSQLLPGQGEGYGLAFLPQGRTLKSDCMVAYYFVATNGKPENTSVHVEKVDKGC